MLLLYIKLFMGHDTSIDLAEAGAEFIIIGGSPLFTRLGHGSDIQSPEV